jgi:putative transposase
VFEYFRVGAGPRACPESDSYINPPRGQPQGVAPTISLPDVVHRFKTLTTTRYRHGVRQNNWALFPGKLWQRNYYEHIIRNEEDLNRIREYIVNNPTQWAMDPENPEKGKSE